MCREAKILLYLSAVFTFAMGLAGIFINIFFWQETKSFEVIVIYNLMHYIGTPIAFFIAGVLSKRKNGIWSLRTGLLLFALSYAIILLIGRRVGVYVYALGLLFGFASGFYWLAYNTLSFDFTNINNRDTFNGFNGSLCGIASAIAPLTSGFLISRYGYKGYHIVFLMAMVLFLILILVSILLKCKSYGSMLNIRKSFSKNCREWAVIRLSTMIWGFRDTTIVFIINILIIQTTKSTLSLGEFSLVAALLSSMSFMLVQRIIKPPKRKFSIFLGAFFSFISVLGLIFGVSYVTLLLYTVLDALFIPFFMIQLSSSTFNVINRAHEENMRIEYMINKDIMINGGRMISSIILLVFLEGFKNFQIIKIYLILISLAPLLSGYFLSRLKAVLEGRT